MTTPPRCLCAHLDQEHREARQGQSPSASQTAHGAILPLGPMCVTKAPDVQAGHGRDRRAPAHEKRGVNLVVLVVRAEDVHRDVHGEPDGLLALHSPPGTTRLLPAARCAACERAAEVVLAEQHLGLASAHDGVERRGALDAPQGPAQQVERPKYDVVGADGDGRAVGKHARDLAPRAAAEGARLPLSPAAASSTSMTPPSAKKRRSPAISPLVSGATSESPLQ